jgi:hypothetical protein
LSIGYYEVSIDSLTDLLRAALEKLPDLVIAVLFGSVLMRNLVREYRCWDIFSIGGESERHNRSGWNA